MDKTKKSEPTKDRRSRGLLEADVKHVTDAFSEGKLQLGDGELLTPHRIVTKMVEMESLDTKPSAGAVTNIIRKWIEIGFASAHPKPLAFKAYTAAGKKEGLDSLKAKAKAKAKKAKEAAKSAATETKPSKSTKSKEVA